MIIVKLMGGLGNQMFQYAAARRLALQHGTEVAFDTSYFDHCPPGDTARQYELEPLSVQARFATPLEIAEMSGFDQSAFLRLKVMFGHLSGAGIKSNLYREESGRFCSEVLALPDGVYLLGFWHSEGYFSDVATTLYEEFKVRTTLDGANKGVASQIAATESVAVHFRRGDYVSSAKTAAFHGNLAEDYYFRAVEVLCRTISNPHLYIFSDDPSWVRDTISFPVSATIVDHNSPDKGYEDLRLMSLCRHAIIANSSFSWWGAWLIRNPHKVVIAPQRWFADPTIETGHFVPSNWLRL